MWRTSAYQPASTSAVRAALSAAATAPPRSAGAPRLSTARNNIRTRSRPVMLTGSITSAFDWSHEVEQRDDADGVNERVEPVPALRPQPLDHGVGRGGGERREAQPCDEADRQIEAQRDLARHDREVVVLVDHEQREMGRGVGEGRHPDHAPDGDELGVARRAHQRRDKERQQEKADRPRPGAMDHLRHDLRIERPGRRQPDDPRRRNEQSGEDDRLQRREAAVAFGPGRVQADHGKSLSLDCAGSSVTEALRTRARVCFAAAPVAPGGDAPYSPARAAGGA